MITRYLVYVLLSSKDKGFYVGFSSNLVNRIKRHKSGKVISTKNRQPLKLIYYEVFIDKKDAKSREKIFKKWLRKTTTCQIN